MANNNCCPLAHQDYCISLIYLQRLSTKPTKLLPLVAHHLGAAKSQSLVSHVSVKMATTSNVIQVHRKQSGNELLKKLTRCPYTFVDDIEADYVMGRTACALYLSVRFHALHPNYIYERVNRLGENYDLRVLLVNIGDHVEHEAYLKELSQLCIRSNLTLMLVWSVEDAALYLEKYKLCEEKPADSIMEKPTNYEYEDALDQYVIDALAESKSINRTDASSLVAIFDSFEKISASSPEELAMCPGVGLNKAQRLYNLLHRPMKRQTGPLSGD